MSDDLKTALRAVVEALPGATKASEQPMLTETQIVSEHPQERRLTLSEWADALEKRASTYAVDDCGWSAEAARFDRALAARLREADEALAKLIAENARLLKPQFYWDPEDPETPRDNAFEYMDEYHPGEIRMWTTGNETGVVYAVMLPAEEDADSDDEWTFEHRDKATVHKALAEELERRARRARGGDHG